MLYLLKKINPTMTENETEKPKIAFKDKHKILNDGIKIMGLLIKIRINLKNEPRYPQKKELKIFKQLDKIENSIREYQIDTKKIIKLLEENKENPHLIKIKKIREPKTSEK